MYLKLYAVFCIIQVVFCSNGDSSVYFEKCIDKCELQNCTNDGLDFSMDAKPQPIVNKVLQWDCASECKYECMWKTTDAFLERKWNVPQFYGKWPFVRFLGIQEPGSFVFSLFNLYGHISGFLKFRTYVRVTAPCFWLWHTLSTIGINAWFWSSIFHARDVPITEFMDYTCAFSLILMHCYCMVQRIFYGMPSFMNALITVFFLAFFINHVIYLNMGRINYKYNLMLNIGIGGVTVLMWFCWSFVNRKRQPYLWKCAAFFCLTAFFTTLEVYDFPPLLWTFDSHAIWHLITGILCPIFYSFIVDDSKYLAKIEQYKYKHV